MELYRITVSFGPTQPELDLYEHLETYVKAQGRLKMNRVVKDAIRAYLEEKQEAET